ncbi:MAG TPA: sugar ABC transporter substrate-binding protein [Intrasporangium sp.]|uniref:sugar ABC transporter substrate-binding protein n=1 Tax=Intrasporangium sp. TaxID=1925024 RepID=UPI002D79E5C6|nr:sugar ABC transporter substrate-binding protein [Intrasporangium sp.]HET7398246.1 sugar ABC transporter substrate-binding protein [Intrasporangium sp.]
MRNDAFGPRTITTLVAVLGSASLAAACSGAVTSASGAANQTSKGTCKPSEVTLVQSGRGLENEYYVSVDAGAKAFAKSKGLEGRYQWIASDGDSSKQLSQIKSILAKGGKCVVLNVDPNESSVLPAIIKQVEQSGAWLVTQWNRPDGVKPETSSPHWVAHMSVDGVPQGYDTAKALFEKMGKKGNIVALQGILDNPPAKERFAGLQKALKEYPNVHLLEDQTAGWDRTKAQNITQTFLTKYGDKVNGIWAANDGMTLGALEALKNANKAGKVPVSGIDGLTEAIAAVGNPATGYVATTQSTAVAQGAYGLAIGFAAATGEIDPASQPVNHRSFYLKPLPVITPDTVKSVKAPDDTSGLDLTNIWAQAGDPIK